MRPLKIAALLSVLSVPFIALAEPGGSTGNHGVLEPAPNSQSSAAVSACPVGSLDDVVCYDNNGAVGGTRTGTTDPDGLMLRPQQCAPSDGTCTAANLILFGGQDTTIITIDGADPSVSCADDNDTVTVTVTDNTGTATATVLTEGTEWTASASVADTCDSLASAVAAVSGLSGATCTSPDVHIPLDPTTGMLILAESTAGCTTVDTGTKGSVAIEGSGFRLDFNGTDPFLYFDTNDYMQYSRASNYWEHAIGATAETRITASGLGVQNGLYVGNRAGTLKDNIITIDTAGGVEFGAHTADPCTSAGSSLLAAGGLFWNSTSGYLCYCDNSGVDLKVVDNSTACF